MDSQKKLAPDECYFWHYHKIIRQSTSFTFSSDHRQTFVLNASELGKVVSTVTRVMVSI